MLCRSCLSRKLLLALTVNCAPAVMDSSAKYKKFAGSPDEEKKPQESRKKFLPPVVLTLVAIAIVTILLVAVAIGVGVGVSRQAGGLTVIVITPEELQGEYYGSVGGIHFQTTVNSSYVTLSVTTESGVPVVNILHPVDLSMTMMGVKSTNFLVMENQPGQDKYMGYVIPNNLTNLMHSMMVGQGNMSNEVLQQLDNKTVDETRQSSLENLASSQEALLIIEAAKALGNKGVQGSDYPSAMSFYQLALQLANARQADVSSFTQRSTEPRQKRAMQCSNVDAVCEQCPFRRYSNNCFGMCGKGCTCWRFVCGDCCVHQYCLTHDQCCADRGFFSFACLSVAWRVRFGSSCPQTYDC